MKNRTSREVMLDVQRSYSLLRSFFKRVAGLFNEASIQLARPPLRLRPIREESLYTYNSLDLDDPEPWLPYECVMAWSSMRRSWSVRDKVKSWPRCVAAIHLLVDGEKAGAEVPELDLQVVHSYKAKEGRNVDDFLNDLYHGTEWDEWGVAVEKWEEYEAKSRNDGTCVFGYQLYRLPLDRITKPDDVRDRVVLPLVKRYEQVRAKSSKPRRK